MVTFAVVCAAAVWRQLPTQFYFEESFEFWNRVPELGLASLWEPWVGYFQVFGRLAFLVAHALGSLAVAHLLAAVVVGLVGAYLTTLEAAIPSRAARIALGLSLAVLPPWWPSVGAYAGPLNSQWWMALAAVGIALSAPRRWHYPALLLGGLSGIGVCLAWPVFRDRRAVPLLAAAAVQGASLVAEGGRQRLALTGPSAMTVAPEYVLVLALVAVFVIGARLPLRTRLSFGYLAAATALAGALVSGPLLGNERYIVAASVCVVLGAVSLPSRARLASTPLGRRSPGSRTGGWWSSAP